MASIVGLALVTLAQLSEAAGGVGHSPTPAVTRPPAQAADGAFDRHALLVGCAGYANLPGMDLKGGANNVAMMRTLLTRHFAFRDERIATLTEGGPERCRPTKANILRELDRLVREAHPGEKLVIYLYGHGSQQYDQDPPQPSDPEPDGLDEVYLPADAGPFDLDRRAWRDGLIDDEISSWLKKFQDRHVPVWLIMDCCTSGTGARAASDEVAFTEVAMPIPPPEGIATGSHDVDFELPLDKSGLVALYATSRPGERTFEDRLPYDVPYDDRAACGLLTCALNEILRQSPAPMTYDELLGRIQMKYVQWRVDTTRPSLEGKDRELTTLGHELRRSPYTLYRDQQGRRAVDGGVLHGFGKGTIFRVHPIPGEPEPERVLGHVHVVEAGVADSLVTPCAYRDSRTVGELPDGARCEPVFIDYGDLRLKVSVDPRDAGGREIPGSARHRLDAALRRVAEASRLVVVVDGPERAEWVVRQEEAGARLVPRQGLARGGEERRRALQPLFGLIPEARLDEDLTDRFRKIARAEGMKRLVRPQDEARVRGGTDVEVKIELLRYRGIGDYKGEVLAPDRIRLHDGELVGFRATNLGGEAIDVTLFHIDNLLGIHPLLPPSSRPTGGRLTKRGDSSRIIIREVTADGVGLNVIVAFAVSAAGVGEPRNFRFLAQEGIQGAKDLDGGKLLENPFGRYLQHVMFGEGDRAWREPLDEFHHAVRGVYWDITPKD